MRVNSYGHSHHLKLLKHFAYIQYGCGMQSGGPACVASTMTLQHHSVSDLPPKKQNQSPTLHMPNSVRMDPYDHSHHIKVPKHFAYIQYGCGIQSEASCRLNHDITTTTSLRLRCTPSNPKSAPHLHRPNSVRVDSYAHSHHPKLPKHCVYIQYGCGMQSGACL